MGDAVQITFDGESISAQDTDTVASALLAAGYRTFTIDPHDEVAPRRLLLRGPVQRLPDGD